MGGQKPTLRADHRNQGHGTVSVVQCSAVSCSVLQCLTVSVFSVAWRRTLPFLHTLDLVPVTSRSLACRASLLLSSQSHTHSPPIDRERILAIEIRT